MTRNQARRATAANAAATRRARQAAAQVGPLAASARMTAQQGVYGARVWAAPRIENAGRVLQERVAPRMAALLAATAHAVEPAPRGRRRRLPVLTAAVAVIAAGGAVAAALLNRRSSATGQEQPEEEPTSVSAARQGANGEHTGESGRRLHTP